MLDTIYLLFSLFILLNVVFFFLGYIVGKLNNSCTYQDKPSISYNKDKKNTKNNNTQILIDEKKIVTTIKTDKLEKKFSHLGDETIVKDNITDNINRLKQVKK